MAESKHSEDSEEIEFKSLLTGLKGISHTNIQAFIDNREDLVKLAKIGDATNKSALESFASSNGINNSIQTAIFSSTLILHYKEDVLTSEDVAYLKWSREMEPVRCTIFQAFARSVSVATSTQNTESKSNANEPESIAEKQLNVRKEAKRFFGRIYHEIIDKGNGKTFEKERFVVYDQFDGEAMDSKQALGPNHDDYITAAHIIPDKAVSNLVLWKVLNEGFQEKYDVNSLRNIILIKNKYSAALEAHKLGIVWNQEKGYFIKVGVKAMKEFGDLNGKPLLFFEGGIQTKDPKYPPYRRSCAYSYLSVIQRMDTIYVEMRKISMTEKEEEEEVNDAEQDVLEVATQESMKAAAQEQASQIEEDK
eukprot:207069_1